MGRLSFTCYDDSNAHSQDCSFTFCLLVMCEQHDDEAAPEVAKPINGPTWISPTRRRVCSPRTRVVGVHVALSLPLALQLPLTRPRVTIPPAQWLAALKGMKCRRLVRHRRSSPRLSRSPGKARSRSWASSRRSPPIHQAPRRPMSLQPRRHQLQKLPPRLPPMHPQPSHRFPAAMPPTTRVLSSKNESLR